MPEEVIIIKQNTAGEETWRYSGRLRYRSSHVVLLEARFNRPDLPFNGILFKEGDLFLEAYFDQRWYNIFEIYDRDDQHLKGWYCNVTEPAVFRDGQVSFVDLALDLLVYPDGRKLALDEDEFARLDLTDQTRRQARRAMQELQVIFEQIQDFNLEQWVRK